MTICLIADDAPFVRMKLTKLLTGNGYEVVTATNGEEVVNLYPLTEPDVVLLDITMPVMDGMAALAAVMTRWPEAQVIMLTALEQEAVVIEAMRLGAKEFMSKPYDPEQLLAVIAKLVNRDE